MIFHIYFCNSRIMMNLIINLLMFLNSQNMVDISLPFAKLFAAKDESEIALLKKSAQATVQAWNYLRRKIVDIVDTDKVRKI